MILINKKGVGMKVYNLDKFKEFLFRLADDAEPEIHDAFSNRTFRPP